MLLMDLDPFMTSELCACLERKPPRVQWAFFYRFYGFTYQEIAEQQACSKNAAWNRINRNCTDIKKILFS